MLLAATLLFSGFVKGVDPRGTQYKLSEYGQALGIGEVLSDDVLLIAAIALAVGEFMLGVLLSLGAARRLATVATTVLFAVMTPLTLWLWIANPVADCGCFGDVLHLSHGLTFAKNILLLVAAVWVLYRRWQLVPLKPRTARVLISDLSLLYIAAIAYIGVTDRPVIDFRPYHLGADIAALMSIPEGEKAPQFETTFVLEKDGKRQEFTLDDYPDSTWTFVDSHTRQVKAGYQPEITGLSAERIDTRQDVIPAVLDTGSAALLLIAYDLDKAHSHNYAHINRLHAMANEEQMQFYCLTAGTRQQIESWQKRTGAEYIFCQSDATTLKTIIRSNPGLMLIRGGKVQAKWSNQRMPDITKQDLVLVKQPTPALQTASVAGGYALTVLMILLAAYIKNNNKHNKTT